MNRLILIGNGYDRALGYDTGYTHFLNWYLKRVASSLNNVLSFRDDIWEISTSTHLNIPESFTNDKNKDIYEFIVAHNNERGKNRKSRLLSRVLKSKKSNTWEDIEESYYELLVEYFEGNLWDEIDLLNKELEGITKLLITYLNVVERSQIKAKEPFTVAQLIEPLDPFKVSRPIITQELIDDFDLNKVLFVSFNYTDFANRLYSAIKGRSKYCDIIYIHGKLNHPENPIVFGYGDETHTTYKKLLDSRKESCLRNIKSFKYLETDNLRRLMSIIDEDFFDVITIGASCGLSDRVMLKTIFEHRYCVQIKPMIRKLGDKDDYFTRSSNIARHFSSSQKYRDTIAIKEDCPWFK